MVTRFMTTSALLSMALVILYSPGSLAGDKVSDVVILDSDNFERLTKGSVWVGKVDTDAEADLGETYQIQGFPTFKIIDGPHTQDYRGEHTVEGFVKFAKEYKPRNAKTSASIEWSKLTGFDSTRSVRETAAAFAAESIGLYTGCVTGLGFFIGFLFGVLFALREKAKVD